jgi:hypothetical protein
MSSVGIGTIVTKSYLSFARVLGQSLRDHHPDIPFFVVLADQIEGAFDPSAEPFEVVPLEALDIPDHPRVCFRYSRLPLTIVAKPYLLRYLLDRGFQAAIFLDADILVLSRLDPLLDATRKHSLVLTPHLSAPLEGPRRLGRELNILQAGVHNGGFVGLSDTRIARQFLDWWADRLRTHCRHAVPEGMHYDQRWLDLASVYFEDVCLVRDQGCNVAYWNLAERDLRMRSDAAFVNGGPCRFFHFSGFEPDRPDAVTRYVPGLSLDAIGPPAALFERYVQLLEAHDYGRSRTWSYAYGRFDNSVQIPDLVRQVYLELDGAAAGFGNPFRTDGPGSYYRWLNMPADDSGARARVTRLWEQVYRRRPDLQQAFPDLMNGDGRAFYEWVVRYGRGEYGIPDAFTSVGVPG